MALNFEIGNAGRPAGHAFVYFSTNGTVLASYVIVLPIKMDMKRYIPPFLTSQIGDLKEAEMPLIILPPAPEKIRRKELIFELARKRGDDVLNGGRLSIGDMTGGMTAMGTIGREYVEACVLAGVRWEGGDAELGVDEVNELVYNSLPTEEKLAKVTGLVGKLFYAVSGEDNAEMRTVEHEIRTLAKTFPANIKLEKVADYGVLPGANARLLAELYLERAYKLHAEDYLRVKEIEDKMRSIDSQAMD